MGEPMLKNAIGFNNKFIEELEELLQKYELHGQEVEHYHVKKQGILGFMIEITEKKFRQEIDKGEA